MTFNLNTLFGLGVSLFASCQAYAANTHNPLFAPSTPNVGLLKLVDSLDRPQDGFCLDIVGFAPHQRLDLPLIAHNCKAGIYKDQAVTMTAEGYVVFVAFQKCLTAIAPHTRALPGNPLMAINCNEHSDFLQSQPLQRFEFTATQQLRLQSSDLCLAVGSTSDQTSASTHRWRNLFLDYCDEVKPALSQWRFVAAQASPL